MPKREWFCAGRKLVLEVRPWAWGFGGGFLVERIQTVCGARRHVHAALDVFRWQFSLSLWGKIRPPRVRGGR
jgi:hypothetical protein